MGIIIVQVKNGYNYISSLILGLLDSPEVMKVLKATINN